MERVFILASNGTKFVDIAPRMFGREHIEWHGGRFPISQNHWKCNFVGIVQLLSSFNLLCLCLSSTSPVCRNRDINRETVFGCTPKRLAMACLVQPASKKPTALVRSRFDNFPVDMLSSRKQTSQTQTFQMKYSPWFYSPRLVLTV